jgi:mRNA interferase RelE/StbE
MNYEIKKSFEKDTDKINDKKILREILSTIENIKNSDSLKDIKNIKKLEGYKNYYRIRIGNYRIGIKFENKTVILVRFLNRKEIYRYFP